MSKYANSLKKRPHVQFLNPAELGERGRDLAVAVRRLEDLAAQDAALIRKFNKLRSDLKAEKEYLNSYVKKLTSELIYLMEVSDVTYEEEVQQVLDSLVEVEEDDGEGESSEIIPAGAIHSS